MELNFWYMKRDLKLLFFLLLYKLNKWLCKPLIIVNNAYCASFVATEAVSHDQPQFFCFSTKTSALLSQ